MRWLVLLALVCTLPVQGQPRWGAIKAGARFRVADTAYGQPFLQPLQVGGWEDGLYITRDGRHLYNTYLPLDALSWITDLVRDPVCFDFRPYYRGPLLGIDTVTNPFGCARIMNSDIVLAGRADAGQPFGPWGQSRLRTPLLFDGGACGVLAGPERFDVFVCTRDSGNAARTDLYLMRDVPTDPPAEAGRAILSSTGQEDNPHIERLDAQTLLLLFDRDRTIYYSLSQDDGLSWDSPVRISQVLNDQAPYDVQPHLWHDGRQWWVFFCADSPQGRRGIYKARQQVPGDWDSWGDKQLVLEGDSIDGGAGQIYGVGEPTLTAWGDLSFVVVYGDAASADTNDVLDCDPWLLPRAHPVVTGLRSPGVGAAALALCPNPAQGWVRVADAPVGAEYRIYGGLGQAVCKGTLPADQTLELEGLAPGLYLVEAGGRRARLLVR